MMLTLNLFATIFSVPSVDLIAMTVSSFIFDLPCFDPLAHRPLSTASCMFCNCVPSSK